ncbi:MAG: hypothetical protein JKY31_01400 [Rhodobacteraceae bacterium]|nr:hypothetical protein [Paracoccaceae bacterium]
MAGDQTFDIKIVIYPFQEMRKKKLTPMMTKEIGLKKPKNYEFKDKFSVTSVKWNKKKIEDAAKTMFRYDLSILGAQMWENYVPIEKAKNGQDKLKKTNAFIKIVPDLLKRTEKKLQQSFAEFKEDMASGASDDVGEIKKAQKGLGSDATSKIAAVAKEFSKDFEKTFVNLKKLKVSEVKSSGADKSKATEELKKACDSAFAEYSKKLESLTKTNANMNKSITGLMVTMKKSQSKDMSDAAKEVYKKSAESFVKPFKNLETAVSRMEKALDAALAKVKKTDVGSTTYELVAKTTANVDSVASVLSGAMAKASKELKKVEQLAKKR